MDFQSILLVLLHASVCCCSSSNSRTHACTLYSLQLASKNGKSSQRVRQTGVGRDGYSFRYCYVCGNICIVCAFILYMLFAYFRGRVLLFAGTCD